MNIRFADGEDDLSAILRLNERLLAGGREEQFTSQFSLPGEARYRPEGFPVYRRVMIAEDGQEVRAAVLLFHNNLFVRGSKRDFCWTDMPLSEGIVDRRYSLAIIQLMKKVSAYQPFLMTLGVGTPDIEAFRFFIKLGWKQGTIPFFFYPVRVTNVLLGLNYLKRSPKLRYGALFGAYSGLGTGLTGILALRRRLASMISGYESIAVSTFDDWADRVFDDSLPEYAVAVRSDATALNIIYNPDNPGFARLRVRRKGTKRDAGWIVVASKQMRNNPYFGNLKVGTLVDGFGHREDVGALVASGLNYLAEIGVDIIVANFSHAAWTEACRSFGMLSGPSNYQIFVSPAGEPLLDNTCPLHEIHMARGHSDGMDHLI